MTSSTIEIDLGRQADFTILNYDYNSFLRVLYRGQILEDLVAVLNSDLSKVAPASRANFVSDYFAFAENDALTGINIERTLNLTQFMKMETEFIVWTMFDGGMSYIRNILKFTENLSVLDEYLQQLIAEYYNALGWAVDVSKVR